MRKNEALVRLLCLPYCHYYKPGRNEELLCRGAVVIKRLIEAGRSLTVGVNPATRNLPRLRKGSLVVRALHSRLRTRKRLGASGRSRCQRVPPAPAGGGSTFGRDSDRDAADMIARLVCDACEFREQDCDFAQDPKARPCGGFVLIAELLKSDTIEIDDLR